MKCEHSGCDRDCWRDLPFCSDHWRIHIGVPLGEAAQERLKEGLDSLLKSLPYREREIIKLRYGIGDAYKYTLEEVGKIFKVSGERVRQIEAKAIRKLQHPVRARKLEQFLDIYAFPQPEDELVQTIQVCNGEILKHIAAHPEAIQGLSSDAFERIVGEILTNFGYEVELTKKTRDGGYDILAFATDKLGVRTTYIVECKRFSPNNPVRLHFVRGLYGVKQQVRADHAILATTSYFTKDAVRFTEDPHVWNLHLKDGGSIREWLKTYENMLERGAVLV